MISKIRKSFITKVLALYLAGSFFFPALTGTMTASANSTGALASEFVANEGSDEFVDLFTGDFNYNIPLMTVPGPNGGYPINLSYSSSGVSMETEASWVGLGWNLNVGAVARNLNGIPDDFKGDEISYTNSMKELIHLYLKGNLGNIDTITAKKDEKLGMSFENRITQSPSFYYDNYTGFGFGLEIGPTYKPIKALTENKKIPGLIGGTSYTISYDSQAGYSFEPKLSLSSKNIELNANISFDKTKNYALGGGLKAFNNYQLGFPQRMRNLPSVNLTTVTTTASMGFTYGESNGTVLGNYYARKNFNFLVTQQSINSNPISYKSYGYLYSEYKEDNGIMDYTKENDIPISKEIPNIPIPIAQPDDFIISGPVTTGMRAFRNDIGIYTGQKFSNSNINLSISSEISNPAGTKIHTGIGNNFTHSIISEGPWQSGQPQSKAFQQKSTNDPKFETYYFKSINEISKSDKSFLDQIGNESAIKNDAALYGLNPNATNIFKNESNSAINIGISQKSQREFRETLIQSITKSQEISNSNYANRANHIWPINSYPHLNPSSGNKIDFISDSKDHHIAKYVVTTSNGMRVEYGLPVYNKTHLSVNYSTAQRANTNPQKYLPPVLANTDVTEASTDNNAGNDEFYSKTSLPAYTYAHLITGIFGDDYVDLTGNGPSEDDLGYYVKFNYSKAYSDFKWRTPYQQSFQHPGHYSDENDDMASFEYGTKEIFYVNSIETKTHIAIFEIELRKDAEEATGGEFNNTRRTHGGNQLYRLKKITLYSKNDLNTPLQTVTFNYSYALCGNWTNATTDHGKLTLESVVITTLNNNKGETRPYSFTYKTHNTGNTPLDYNTGRIDRWGNSANLSNADVTYDWDVFENRYLLEGDYNRDFVIDQDDQIDLNDNVSAWMLTSIKTPTNGEIMVEYESDDYGYVQNKTAQSMFQIVGTSKTTETTPDADCPIGHKDLRIYFKLKTPISYSESYSVKQQEIAKYIQGMDKIYFKTFQKLRKSVRHPLLHSFDYVKGYAEIETDNSSYGLADVYNQAGTHHTVGYITVKQESYFNNAKSHPFRMAGFQYLRTERSDLDLPGGNPTLGAMASSVINAITGLSDFWNYYNSATIKNWCSKIHNEVPNTANSNPNDDVPRKPSFIRLNSPDKTKPGGGHRVKSITVKDNWNEGVSQYKKEYSYKLMDGKSSGVAASEPLSGDEECALKYPVYYNSNENFTYKNEKRFIEYPLNQSYFPSPVVGYSRVAIKTSSFENTSKNTDGISVIEFYTAKDYPVKSTFTNLDPIINRSFFLGFNTYNQFNQLLVSQGYFAETNDMHGNIKSVSTFKEAIGANNLSQLQLVSKVDYIYSNNDQNNGLKNEVKVLHQDAIQTSERIGEFYDFYLECNEYSQSSTFFGLDFNITSDPTSVIPFLEPSLGINETSYYTIATNKHIFKKGILKEIRFNEEGTLTQAFNLMFDPYSGESLLTSTTNSFKQPVYAYSFPAYWHYKSLGGAYQNIGAEFLLTHSGSGGITLTNADKFFHPGDVIQVSDLGTNVLNEFYVVAVNNTGMVMEDRNGNFPTFTNKKATIIRSGFRNQIAFGMGSLVSLKNPVTEREADVFTLYNYYISGQNLSSSTSYTFNDVKSCITSNLVDVSVSISSNQITFAYTGGPYDCSMNIGFSGSLPTQNLADYEFVYGDIESGTAQIKHRNGSTFSGTFSNKDNCFGGCFTVLFADAIEYSDNWNYNYKDAGDPIALDANGLPSQLRTLTNANEYRYGQKGIWKGFRSNVYLINRLQSGSGAPYLTKINQDGEYSKFDFFQWGQGAVGRWTWASQVTRVNPYGYTLETQDKLGIFSSSLLAHNNSVSSAGASNCEYYELAFDGFEDYGTETTTSLSHGHLSLFYDNTNRPNFSSLFHTGKNSISLSDNVYLESSINGTNPDYFRPLSGKEYLVSAWFYHIAGTAPSIEILVNGSPITTEIVNPNFPNIDGWTKVDVKFTCPTSGTLKVRFIKNGATALDDLRIHPFKGAMTASVYHPLTLWKLADLDNQNMATYYNYDEEGNVVQVKKETIRGVLTIATSRSNLKKQ